MRKFFYCPHKCGDPRFPRPKWKTENGYNNHLKKCPNRPEEIARLESIRLKREEEMKRKSEIMLESFPYEIGDEIILVSYRITKPTHEQRFTRMVRVRYEEERRYFSEKTTVKTVEVRQGSLVVNCDFNNKIWDGDIDSAKREAAELQKVYDQGCHEASMHR